MIGIGHVTEAWSGHRFSEHTVMDGDRMPACSMSTMPNCGGAGGQDVVSSVGSARMGEQAACSPEAQGRHRGQNPGGPKNVGTLARGSSANARGQAAEHRAGARVGNMKKAREPMLSSRARANGTKVTGSPGRRPSLPAYAGVWSNEGCTHIDVDLHGEGRQAAGHRGVHRAQGRPHSSESQNRSAGRESESMGEGTSCDPDPARGETLRVAGGRPEGRTGGPPLQSQ